MARLNMADYVKGVCQVCGTDDLPGTARFFCAEHRPKEHRPPADEWVHVPPGVTGTPAGELPDRQAEDLGEPGTVTGGSDPREPAPASPYEPSPSSNGAGWRDRLRQAVKGKKAAPKAPPEPGPREKAPRRKRSRGARISAAHDLSGAWGRAGKMLGREGSDWFPVGRMLTYQSEGAGVILDDYLAGSFVDRAFLQPGLEARDRIGGVWSLTACPVLTAAITWQLQQAQAAIERGDQDAFQRHRATVDFLLPWLEEAIDSNLVPLSKAIKRSREEEARRAQAFSDAFPEMAEQASEAGIAPAKVILGSIFGQEFTSDERESTHASPV